MLGVIIDAEPKSIDQLRMSEIVEPGCGGIEMKLDEPRQGWHRFIICAIALLGAAPLLYVMGGLAVDYVPKLGMAPCDLPDSLTRTAHGLQAFLLAVGLWFQFRTYRHSSYASLAAVLLLPLIIWLVQNATNGREAQRQRQCASRTFEEAMKACGANPAFYRLEKSKYGTDVATLIAPGSTDKALSCLYRWEPYKDTISIEVDDSVYDAARRAHSKYK